MPLITLITHINALIETCFDLSRSIDLHMQSADQTNEKVIGGVASGLISMGQEVTWRARHFGVWQSLTSCIVAFDRPHHFRDSMQKGPFKYFDHDHYFEFKNELTIMRDDFNYSSPLGVIGSAVDALFLKDYMRRFLIRRNETIKFVAENNPEEFLSLAN